MHEDIQIAVNQLLADQQLDAPTIHKAIGVIMDGAASETAISSLLTALAIREETDTAIAGAALAMRERSTKISTQRSGLIDTCGTGGDNLHTFNISTATAFVVAAAGIPVAKHGNRSVSSSSGSADVLEALGVNIELSAEQAGKCLDEIGLCFCYARLFHGAMKHVAPVRQELGFRTIFNLLGPLTNPANAEFQLLGANNNITAEKLARAATHLNVKRIWVVCGNDQLDEVSLWGNTKIWEISGQTINQFQTSAEDLGLQACTPEQLHVTSPQQSAQSILNLLSGKPGPHRDIVLANTAAALMCAGKVSNLAEGVKQAASTIDDRKAFQLLSKLISWTTTER